MFIVLLSFIGSLATKCMSLNNEQCKTRLFLIVSKTVELKYYLFMITLDKCIGSCNSFGKISDSIIQNKKCKFKCF